MSVNWNELIPTRRSLLSRLKDWDDQKCWQDFYQVYHPLIYGAAIKAGLTESEAEDVVQDTTVAVAKAIGSFKYQPEHSTFKTWLHSIAKRQVANQFRKRLGKGRVWESLPEEQDEAAMVNGLSDPASHALDETWEREWEHTLLEAAKERVKRKVSPAQMQIYDFHVLQAHSVVETTRTLGVSVAKVYLAKHRVGAQVRNEIAYLRTKLV